MKTPEAIQKRRKTETAEIIFVCFIFIVRGVDLHEETRSSLSSRIAAQYSFLIHVNVQVGLTPHFSRPEPPLTGSTNVNIARRVESGQPSLKNRAVRGRTANALFGIQTPSQAFLVPLFVRLVFVFSVSYNAVSSMSRSVMTGFLEETGCASV